MRFLKSLKYINIIGLCVSLELFSFGLLMENANMLVFSIAVVVAVIVCNSISKLENGIVLLFYMVSFVTFMMSRPLLNLFIGPSENDIYFKPLTIVYTAILCIYFGALLCKDKARISPQGVSGNTNRIETIRFLSKIIFYSTLIFAWAETLEKVLLVRNLGYIGLYTAYNSALPAIVHKLSVVNETSFFVFIMTFPSKKNIYMSFGIYCFGLFLKLLTGVRGDLMTGLMLLVTYTIFRNRVTKQPIFTGKSVKYIFAVSVVLLVSYMGIYASIRLGQKSGSLLQGFAEFFTQQGGTIVVLKNVIGHIPQLKAANSNYTFSPILDYNAVTRWIGNVLFGFNLDGSKLHSGQLGNNLTYILERSYFEAGGSFGTAYLAELFIDYSYPGVAFYNLMLGYLLKKITTIKLSNWIVGAYYLYIIRTIYFLPRDSALSFVTPILSLTNLLLIFGIKLLSDMIYMRMRRRIHENTLVGKYNS